MALELPCPWLVCNILSRKISLFSLFSSFVLFLNPYPNPNHPNSPNPVIPFLPPSPPMYSEVVITPNCMQLLGVIAWPPCIVTSMDMNSMRPKSQDAGVYWRSTGALPYSPYPKPYPNPNPYHPFYCYWTVWTGVKIFTNSKVSFFWLGQRDELSNSHSCL